VIEYNIIDLGLIDYLSAFNFQRYIFECVRSKILNDTIIFCEHPSVFTIGRSGSLKNLIKKTDIPVYFVDRGGDITYHGPGQILGYLIFDLKNYQRDIFRFLRSIEDLLICVLKDYKIEANRIPGLTGVWVDNKKIASIGIAIKKWITFHGFALNVNCDLFYFSYIKPCGLNIEMTSLEKILKEKVDTKILKRKIRERFNLFFKGGRLCLDASSYLNWVKE